MSSLGQSMMQEKQRKLAEQRRLEQREYDEAQWIKHREMLDAEARDRADIAHGRQQDRLNQTDPMVGRQQAFTPEQWDTFATNPMMAMPSGGVVEGPGMARSSLAARMAGILPDDEDTPEKEPVVSGPLGQPYFEFPTPEALAKMGEPYGVFWDGARWKPKPTDTGGGAGGKGDPGPTNQLVNPVTGAVTEVPIDKPQSAVPGLAVREGFLDILEGPEQQWANIEGGDYRNLRAEMLSHTGLDIKEVHKDAGTIEIEDWFKNTKTPFSKFYGSPAGEKKTGGAGYEAYKKLIASRLGKGGFSGVEMPELIALGKQNGMNISEIVSSMDGLSKDAMDMAKLEVKYGVDVLEKKFIPAIGKAMWVTSDPNRKYIDVED